MGCQKACVLPENPASYRVVRTKSYLFNKAEGIRQAVSEYQTLSVTVSIGVAEHHDGETVEQLFSRVDKALYAAKNDGRNRVSRMPFDSSERRRSRDGAA
ncbi:diguanylate cyclase [Klebsiella pneumoniae]|uniref:diguanylate cyclase n=1 Tax=Klebsiella pneumoniae TaxID=573 RepID=UPI00210B0AB8|nr:diguanylate cyclase [Klebsiella pneumoniae]WLX49793.1 diguanylate cyclase [Klebsiella pneumoniae]